MSEVVEAKTSGLIDAATEVDGQHPADPATWGAGPGHSPARRLRIAHVVTYVSADGAFGGPVAVALAQTEELVRRGHRVDLLAGWDGSALLPEGGAVQRLFRVRRVGPGFSGLIAPGLLSWLRRHGGEYDVVHVHLGRDLVTLPAAALARAGGGRTVVQAHGMVAPDRRVRARVLDTLLTRRTLRRAGALLALTEAEVAGLHRVAGVDSLPVATIPNGIRGPIEVPEVTRATPPVVMFLARLHPRKRVLAFAEAAAELIRRGTPAQFEVVGPDEGDLPALTEFLHRHQLTDRILYRGAIAQGHAIAELARATVYVLPSYGEVFPMTVLEAFAAGTATVLGADCGMAPELTRRQAALVNDATPQELAGAIAKLLDEPGERDAQVERAAQCLREWLSIEAVVDRLEQCYGLRPPDRLPGPRR